MGCDLTSHTTLSQQRDHPLLPKQPGAESASSVCLVAVRQIAYWEGQLHGFLPRASSLRTDHQGSHQASDILLSHEQHCFLQSPFVMWLCSFVHALFSSLVPPGFSDGATSMLVEAMQRLCDFGG